MMVPKWEYCSLLADMSRNLILKHGGKPPEVIGTEDGFIDYLNVLGNDGWELVSEINWKLYSGRAATLKRQRS